MLLVPLLGAGPAGCTLIELHQENVEYSAATVLAGRVSGAAWQGPVTVAAIQQRAAGPVVRHDVWLHEPGGFDLVVPDGEYLLVAFADRDNDGRPDEDAPAGTYPTPVKVEGTGLRLALNMTLEKGEAEEVRMALPRGYHRAARPSTAPGALADLDDARFSAESGKRGYWAPMEYFRTLGGNVYFIEPYDPRRTPVLFVHGATGSAQDWRYFVEARARGVSMGALRREYARAYGTRESVESVETGEIWLGAQSPRPSPVATDR